MHQEAGGSTRHAAAFLAKARHTQDTSARIGLILAAADKASQGIAEGNAGTRARYTTLLAQNWLCCLRDRPPCSHCPSPLRRRRSCVLKFDNGRVADRWDANYFTNLLTPSELKNKTFVSKQPPEGYGGVLVGVHRPPNPRALLLPWVGVSAPVTAVINFSKPAKLGQPVQANLTLYDRQSAQCECGQKTVRWPPICVPSGYYQVLPSLASWDTSSSKVFRKRGFSWSNPTTPKRSIVFVHGLMAARLCGCP
jgi:hypothetical protein